MGGGQWSYDSHDLGQGSVCKICRITRHATSVRLGDGRTVKAEGKGSVRLCVSNNNDAECVIRLSSVLLVSDLSCNLFSVRDITDKGNKMLFDDVTCSIISKDNLVIASGHKRGNLYLLDGAAEQRHDEAMVVAQPSSDLWH